MAGGKPLLYHTLFSIVTNTNPLLHQISTATWLTGARRNLSRSRIDKRNVQDLSWLFVQLTRSLHTKRNPSLTRRRVN